MSVQQIYLPLEGRYPIPYEFEADTLPVPRGQYSVLWALRDGDLTAAQAMAYFCLNHRSSWDSGITWGTSTPYLSKILGAGMSRRYLQKTLVSLNTKGWIETLDENNPAGKVYRIQHHLCSYQDVPVDENDKPLTFAVPRGPGGPLERCFDGDISWKAALVWIVLKWRSNWKAHENTAGQTELATLLQLSKRCRIGLSTFNKVIIELMQAGMLERMSAKSKLATFQLYPKPRPKPTEPRKTIRREWVEGKETKTDGEYWYSLNNRYRCPVEDYLKIEMRQRGGEWKKVSEYHKYQLMPQVIRRDFERIVTIHCSIKASLEG